MNPQKVVLMLALLVGTAYGYMCSDNKDLKDVTSFKYKIPHPLKDLGYWRSYHLMYYWFGKFDTGNKEKLTASYSKEDGSVIYEAVIDCKAGTWTTKRHNMDDDKLEEYKSGKLEGGCKAGVYDLIFKVEQPYIMKWLFNGQGLEDDLVERPAKQAMRVERIKPGYMSISASSTEIKAENGATVTRFSFGKCVAWPKEITNNCNDVKKFLLARSKFLAGNAAKGAYNQVFTVDCLSTNDRYFTWIQEAIHPDRTSYKPLCCCLNMKTGVIPSPVEDNCQSTAAQGCKLRCMNTYDPEIIAANFNNAEEAEGETVHP